MKTKKIILFAAVLFIFVIFNFFALAEEKYTTIETYPTLFGYSYSGQVDDLSTYLQWVFAFGISASGILAVLMIVIGGIQYITAYGNSSTIENARNRITQALLGLLLAVCAWLILYTINPDLAKGKLTIPCITGAQCNKQQ